MNLYRWFLDRPLYKNSFIFFVGTILAGVAGYLYQLTMSRMLSLSDFGALASLLGLLALVGVPMAVVSTLTTRQVSVFQARRSVSSIAYLVRTLSRVIVFFGALLLVVFLIAGPWVKEYLHLDSLRPYYILAASLPLAFIMSIWRGVLPGLQRFRVFSTSQIIESGLKLCLAIGFVMATRGLEGALVAQLIASAIAACFVGWCLRDIFAVAPAPILLSHLRVAAATVFVWTLALAALQSMDVILVKRFFVPDEAGVYAAFSLLGKIIFFGATSVAGVLLPMATELYETGKHRAHRRLLHLSLALVSGLAGLGVMLYWLAPTLVVRIFLGARYVPFVQYLFWFGLVGFCLSVIQILATYLLSIERRWFLCILGLAPLLEVVLVYQFHGSLLEVLKILVMVLGLLAAALFGCLLFSRSVSFTESEI